MLAQKRPYAFLVTNRLCRLIWCPVGWLVRGCGARAVTRKAAIYFIQIDKIIQIVKIIQIDKIAPADYADDAANSLPRTLSLKSEIFFKMFHRMFDKHNIVRK